jgi:CubicO group peptidase (beta-lactamase class C family)
MAESQLGKERRDAAPEEPPAKRFPATHAMIANAIASGEVPGGVAALGRGSEPPSFFGIGSIAFDDPTPADENTLWRIYSMTKPVTGMAAMILIDEGAIGLDQPLAHFIPDFAHMTVLTDPQKSLEARLATAPITIRHLLTHTAGFGYTIITTGPLLDEYKRHGIVVSRRAHVAPDSPDYLEPAPSLDEFCRRLAALPLIAEPGTKWSYSIAQDVLGRVIELAAGKTFDAYLRERLFEPLGMTSTDFHVRGEDVQRLATNYMTVEGETVAIDPGRSSIYLDSPPFPFGGTGLVSTARDYDRFLSMMLNKGMFEGREIMRPQAVAAGMSNLLPEGADLSSFIWWPDPAVQGFGPSATGSGFGAGGRVSLSGPDKGTFSWSGAASTNMFVDPVRNIRASAYINSMTATFTFATLINRAMARDLR